MRAIGVVIALTLACSGGFAFAEDVKPKRPAPKQQTKQPKIDTKEKATKTVAEDDLAPPLAGSPSRGVGARMEPAASRGSEIAAKRCELSENPRFAVFGPAADVGYTSNLQPILYWYVSAVPRCEVLFTLSEEDADAPIIETPLAPIHNPGLQQVPLSQLGVHLEAGKAYRWFIAVVPDTQRRSLDLLAGAKLGCCGKEANGWYDAFASACVTGQPGSPDTGGQRRCELLLREAGLGDLLTPVVASNRAGF